MHSPKKMVFALLLMRNQFVAKIHITTELRQGMLDFWCAGTDKVFVVPTIFDVGDNHPSPSGDMYKFIISQIDPYMIYISSPKRKKHQISLVELSFIFSFYLIAHIARRSRQIFIIYFTIQNPDESRTVYS